MMGSGASSDATGDVPCDGVEAPSQVESFSIKTRQIPRAYGGLTTPMGIFSTGRDVFVVGFGDVGSEFALHTDERGLDVIIGACLAAKVRAS